MHKRSQAMRAEGCFPPGGHWRRGWLSLMAEKPQLLLDPDRHSVPVGLPMQLLRLSSVLSLIFPHNPTTPQSTEVKPPPRCIPCQRILTCALSLGLLSWTRNGSPHHSPPSVSVSPNFFLPWVFLSFQHLFWSHYVLEWNGIYWATV